LQHEALFHLTGTVLNLTEPEAQAALLEKCRQDKIEILLLDNLSCLFSGMRENDADAWERVLPWLLDLRRNRIAVIFVAHSGRNGMMRGTSRREDAAFWIIDLLEIRDATESRHGAKFIARFVKNRNTIDADCPALEWTFVKPPGHVNAVVSWKKIVTPDRFRQCIEDGLVTASQIAEDMCLSRGQISKYATKAIKEGWLVKKGREYAFAPKKTAGAEALESIQKMLSVKRPQGCHMDSITTTETEITVELVDRVSERVATGVPLDLALAGEPVSVEEYEEHLRQHPELAAREGVAKRMFLQKTVGALLTNGDASTSANIRWLLERLYPDVFERGREGKRDEATVEPIQTIRGVPEEVLNLVREEVQRNSIEHEEGRGE
jgi:hypothetical protein